MKCVIFDLDGTLLYTLEDIKNSLNHGLNSIGMPQKSIEEVRKIIGGGALVTLQKLANRQLSENELNIAHANFIDYYSKHYLDSTLPYNNVKELINCFKTKGLKLAIVSNKSQSFVDDLIQRNFPNLFDIVYGANKDQPRKPDPYFINKVLETLNISSNDAIYVGDTEIDFQTGTNAKVKTVLVDYGYRTREELIERCPNAIIVHSNDEIKKQI